ncbi:LOW QUALITY PROTEIN: coiled-coil domain-containing protein 169 [Tautogolabrus adspersus]
MTGDSDYSKYDLARLQAELEQEREMKEMLEESVSDLRNTMFELQERLHSVDGEGNEWKTRYETQIELNGQLERQMSLIHERLEDLRGNPMGKFTSHYCLLKGYKYMIETLKQRLKILTEEKSDLQSQLMDCHLQIEQEGKAFHKTNDERRAYLSEIAKLSSTLDVQRRQCSHQPQRAPESKQKRGKQASRMEETKSKKGEEREEDGGGVSVTGGDVSGATVERREEKKFKKGSRLPTVKS